MRLANRLLYPLASIVASTLIPLASVAAIQTVSFNGVFNSSNTFGDVDGIDPSTLNGDAVSGVLSYDPAQFAYNSSTINYNYFSGSVIDFDINIGPDAFYYDGSYFDQILTGAQSQQVFYSSVDAPQVGASLLVYPGSSTIYANGLDLNTIGYYHRYSELQLTDVNPAPTPFNSAPDYWNIYVYATLPLSVPEPSSWALVIVGFFSIGAALRRGTARRLSPRGSDMDSFRHLKSARGHEAPLITRNRSLGATPGHTARVEVV